MNSTKKHHSKNNTHQITAVAETWPTAIQKDNHDENGGQREEKCTGDKHQVCMSWPVVQTVKRNYGLKL